MPDGDDRFASVAEQVIRDLRGDPNPHLSNRDEIRWGNSGSLSLKIKTGQIYDHEQEEGGGLVDFIQREVGLPSRGEAFRWLEDHGYVEDRPREGQEPPKAARTGGGPPPDDPQDPGPQPDPPAARTGPRLDDAGNWVPDNLPEGAHLARAYDYRDENGDLAYQVCRYDWPDPGSPKGRGKHFLQRIPDPSKKHGFTYKTKGMRWLPYRLPELMQDVPDGRVVFIVEGEKKVDMLRERGVPATCNHGGAGKWPEDLVRHFHGARVCILPDNDKAGQDHATLIGRKLRPVADGVMVLNIPGLPEKGGVDDWLPAGGTVEALYRLLRDEAEAFVPPPPKSSFGGVPWGQLDAPGPQLEFIIKGVLASNEVSMLVGESQSGKSFLALDLALAVARGEGFFGHKVRRGGVIYQAGESAVGIRRRRIPAYRKHFDVWQNDLPFVLLERQVDLFGSEDQAEALVKECIEWRDTFDVPLDLIVIDTLNRATPGANENDGKDMSLVLERAERLRRETGAAIMMVHHMNASGTRARGHTSLYANVDTVIQVNRLEDVTDSEGSKVREWTINKQKDGEDGVRHRFVLPSVQIGTDEDGDAITSCIVAEPGGVVDRPASGGEGAQVSGTNALALRAIYDAISEYGEQPPQRLRLPSRTRAVSLKTVKAELRRVIGEDAADNARPAEGETPDQARERAISEKLRQVAGAREALFSRGIIKYRDDWLWLTGKRVRGFPPPPGSGAGGWTDGPDAPAEGATAADDLPFGMEDFT